MPLIDNLCPGVYGVTVTDANGCSTDTSHVVTAPALVISNISSTPTSCGTCCDGTLSATSSGGTAPYAYCWYQGLQPCISTSSTLTNVCVGNYVLEVTDAAGCVDTTHINMPATGCAISVGGVQTNVSCFGGSDGIIDVAPTGGTAPYTYLWSTGAISTAITGLTAGVYSITVEDANGCANAQTFVIAEPLELTGEILQVNIGCPNNCNNDLLATTGGGTFPWAYQWSDMQTSSLINFCGGPTQYSVTITDANGCVHSDTLHNVVYDTLPHATLPDSAFVCYGDTIPAILSADPGAIYYQWSDGVTGMPINHVYSNTLSLWYTVTVSTPNTCTIVDSVFLADTCYVVWPGDCNNDGIADNTDLLPIGIAYGATGPIRPNASLAWTGQVGADWQFPWIGDKYTDTDGNGVISASDTIAIVQNYGLTHNKTYTRTAGAPSSPDLYFDFSGDTLATGLPFEVDVNLGTMALPADSVYGLAFKVLYDPTLLDSGSANMSFNSSWIGTYGTDMLAIQKNVQDAGELHVAITRINQQDVSGYGPIARFGGITIDNLSGKNKSVAEMLTLEIVDVEIYSISGIERPVNSIPSELIVEENSSNTETAHLFSAVRVFPVPASDLLTVRIAPELEVSQVSLLDLSGKQLNHWTAAQQNVLQLDVSGFENGVYLLQMATASGTLTKRIAIAR